VWSRFRIDYGEDVQHTLTPFASVGHLGTPAPRYDTDGSLADYFGLAQFGEVEDYVLEFDVFPGSLGEITISGPLGVETVQVSGPTTVMVDLSNLGDENDNGLEEVQTEIVQLQLTGMSDTLGPVEIRLRPSEVSPFQRSTGIIEEKDNQTPGVLDLPPFTEDGAASSHFDVFFEIEVAGMLLHNNDPKVISTQISHKPPAPGETYVSFDVIPLFDEDGQPTGINVETVAHTPVPLCPWDCGVPPDGLVSVLDFLAMLSQWGGPGSCDFNIDGVVSILDFLAMLAHWGPCPLPLSDCCFAHGSPGCDDLACEALVCEISPDCCDVEWVQECADLARGLCPSCGTGGSG
jgi:hypothetical protein